MTLRLLDGVLDVSICGMAIRFGLEISNCVFEDGLVCDLLQGFVAKGELT